MIGQFIFFLISIASILYGVLVMSIGSGSRFYLFWYVLALFSLGLAALCRFHLWGKGPRAVWIAAGAVFAAGLICFCLLLRLILSGYGETGKKDLDYLIVLGAQVFAEGPSVSLQYRLDAAVDYLNENEDTVCIVSGGQGKNEPISEAEGMRRYLIGKGIDAARILPEDRSTSTLENIRFSAGLFDAEKDSVGIVTNDFHIYRALMIARREGYKDLCGIAAKSNPLFTPNNVVREVFGLVKDTLIK